MTSGKSDILTSRRHYPVLFFMLMLVISGCSEPGMYVSPDGSDDHPGTKSKPFRTIQKAQEAIRDRLADGASGALTVWLADGSYFLSEPLTYGIHDSGCENTSITYKALKGANPVISGGAQISAWKASQNGLWIAEVEPGLFREDFRELFIDGVRATRARHPDTGYLRVAEVGSDRRTNFQFNTGDFPAPQNQQDVELVLIHDWSISRIPLAEIDYSGNRITAADTIGAKSIPFFNLDNWETHPRYFLENDQAFLDTPGEWYFDNSRNLLYLMLPPDADPGNMEITIPATGPHLVVIEGTEQQPVRNIHFEGISFRYCAWAIPEKGYAGIQACHFDPRPAAGGWSVVPAAIYLQWAGDCTFSRCSFSQLGGSALWFSAGCTGCTVENSHFEDISGNGIMIGDGRDRQVDGQVWWKSAPEQTASGNVAVGNTITGVGRQFYGAVGIWCGFTSGTDIRGNLLYDLPYTGISIGWEWSPIPTPCRDNHLTGNHIHHVMQVLSDGGGIYMLGLQPGSTITGNLIHDVPLNAGRAESNGMFLDEGTTDVTVSGNIVYNIAKSPLRFHRATTNLVKDNIFSCGDDTPPVRYNTTREEDITLENNLILQDSDPDNRMVLEEAIAQWHLKNKR
ncbi:MAG: right-handed parallel beta-helix repeat-containing protein [Bacteroidota bacterium]